MGQNRFVQYGALVLLLVALFVGVKSCQRETPAKEDSVSVGGGDRLSEEALAGLGIEGDTEKDVVATLIGEVRNMKENMTHLRDDNAALRADNADLKTMEQTIGRRLASELTEAEQQVLQQSSAEVQTMLRRLDAAERQLAQVQSQRAVDVSSPGAGLMAPEDTVWVQPLGVGRIAKADC